MKVNMDRASYIRAIASKEHVNARLVFLKEQASVLGGEVIALKRIMEYEQQDVERLESINGVAILYTLLGKKDEMLDKEKREAVLAVEKFKLAESELKNITKDIEKCERELIYIARCEEKYKELMKSTLSDVSSKDENTELVRLKDEAVKTEARLRETEEAISAGEKVFSQIDEIIDILNKYNSLRYSRKSTLGERRDAWDNLMIADNKLSSLPTLLSRFRAELADVELVLSDDIIDEEMLQYSLIPSTSCILDSLGFGNDDTYYFSYDLGHLKGQISRVIHRLTERRERLRKRYEYACKKIEDNISL